MPRYSPTYEQYRRWQTTAPDEGGNTNEASLMTEEQWDALSDAERHENSGGRLLGAQQENWYSVGEDDDIARQFREQFGATTATGIELQDTPQTGLALGYADGNGVPGPSFGRADWNQLAVDPSRILWLDPEGTPNRRYVFERENMRPEPIIEEQARVDNSGLGDNFWIVGVAAVVGGGLLANAMMAEGAAAAGAAESTSAATLANSEAALASQTAAGGGVTGTAPATQGIISSAVPAATDAGLLTAADYTVAAANPALSAAPEIAGSSWWSSLSPQSQSLLTRAGFSAASSGASAMMQANAQRNAQEFATQQADRARTDRREEEERGRTERLNNRAVAPRNITVTPRNTGIIGSTTRGG